MRYLLLIYTDEHQDARRPPAEQEAIMGDYFAFTNEGRAAGVLQAGEALHPTTAATTVRLRQGQISSSDGPFAETKEQLGGYYLLNCENLDEAIQWAAKIPAARGGSVEIRPVWEFEN
jgi:hypothetical protein